MIRIGKETIVSTLRVPDEPFGRSGFAPAARSRTAARRTGLVVHAIAALGLTFSLAVAAAALTINIARAQSPAPVIQGQTYVTTAAAR